MVLDQLSYGHLCWEDVDSKLRNKWIIWPTGTLEQHGPHLPLAVDSIICEKISMEIAAAVNGTVAPTMPFGARSIPNSGGGPKYPGTIRIRGEVLISIYRDVIESFLDNGFAKIAIINGHWENEPFMIEAIEQCRESNKLCDGRLVALSWWSVVPSKDMKAIFGKFNGWHVEHAGQAETALMICLAPSLVNTERLVDSENEIPQGIYKFPTPIDWEGKEGALSSSSHVTKQMGVELKSIIVKEIINILKDS